MAFIPIAAGLIALGTVLGHTIKQNAQQKTSYKKAKRTTKESKTHKQRSKLGVPELQNCIDKSKSIQECIYLLRRGGMISAYMGAAAVCTHAYYEHQSRTESFYRLHYEYLAAKKTYHELRERGDEQVKPPPFPKIMRPSSALFQFLSHIQSVSDIEAVSC